jgi:class 3 adenylate cyclase
MELSPLTSGRPRLLNLFKLVALIFWLPLWLLAVVPALVVADQQWPALSSVGLLLSIAMMLLLVADRRFGMWHRHLLTRKLLRTFEKALSAAREDQSVRYLVFGDASRFASTRSLDVYPRYSEIILEWLTEYGSDLEHCDIKGDSIMMMGKNPVMLLTAVAALIKKMKELKDVQMRFGATATGESFTLEEGEPRGRATITALLVAQRLEIFAQPDKILATDSFLRGVQEAGATVIASRTQVRSDDRLRSLGVDVDNLQSLEVIGG